MKKLLAFILVSVMLLALAACTLPDLGDDGDNSDEKKDEEDGLPVIEGDKYTAKHMRSYFPEYDAFDEQVIEFIKGKDLCEITVIDYREVSAGSGIKFSQKYKGTVNKKDGKFVLSLADIYAKTEIIGISSAEKIISAYKAALSKKISESQDAADKKTNEFMLKACDGKYVKADKALVDLFVESFTLEIEVKNDKISSITMNSIVYDFTYHENGNIASSNMTDSDSNSEGEATTYHENGNIASIYQQGDLFTFDQDGKFIPIDEK